MTTHTHNTLSLVIETINHPIRVIDIDLSLALSADLQCHITLETVSIPNATESLPGKEVQLVITDSLNQSQRIKGYIYLITSGRLHADGYRTYEIQIQSWFGFLRLTQDCRIYQNQTVLEIVQSVFMRYRGLAQYDFSRICESYLPRTYCVQYNETDFDFVNRLLEEEGIYYYFCDTDDAQELILADRFVMGPSYPDPVEVVEAAAGMPHFKEWITEYTFSQTRVSTRLYTPHQPRKPLSVRSHDLKQNAVHTHETFEHYQVPLQPGLHSKAHNRETLTKQTQKTLDHLGSTRAIMRAQGNYLCMIPGMCFDLVRHQDPKMQGKYVLTQVKLHVCYDESNHVQTALNVAMIPEKTRYFPTLKTPKPRIEGYQHAIVAGPKDTPIYANALGSVKVQFPWDRHGESNENSSCWVRCIQAWGGEGYGVQFVPRVGQMVMVVYEDCDPDRPLIRGLLPNVNEAMPFTPDQTPTRSGFKTQTIGSDDPNEGHMLRLDDDALAPEIKLHSSGDLTLRAKGQVKRETGGSSTTVVQGGDYHHRVSGELTVQAAKAIELVCGNSSITLDESGVTFEADQIFVDGKPSQNPLDLNGMSSQAIWQSVMKATEPCADFQKPTYSGNTQPPTRLYVQIADQFDSSEPSYLTVLLPDITLSADIVYSDSSKADETITGMLTPGGFMISGPDFQTVQSVKLCLKAQSGEMAGQALYCIGVNAQPTDGPKRTITLMPKAWQTLPHRTATAGQITYHAALTLLAPSVMLNVRQGAWQGEPLLTGADQSTFEALSSYMPPTVQHCSHIDVVMPSWLLAYCQANGNNANIFIHGYNVQFGAYACAYEHTGSKLEKDPSTLETIYRDDSVMWQLYGEAYTGNTPDDLNGTGAHKWLTHMEHNLNQAAGFDGKDYTNYTRLIGFAWEGDPVSPLDYMAAPPLTRFGAKRIVMLIKWLKHNGVRVNLMAHSLGNEVLMNVLEACGEANIEVDHVFMWEAAIPNNCFEPQARQYFPMVLNAQPINYGYHYPNAQQGAKAVTVLYSSHDNILGAMADDQAQDVSGMSSKAVIEKALYEWAMTVVEMESNTVINRHSDNPHIADLIAKRQDPAAGFLFAMIAQGIDSMDQYLLPLGHIHKQLLSLYHVANMFVYPLSYFSNEQVSGINPRVAMNQFYEEWSAFYPNFQQINTHTGKAYQHAFGTSLSEQTALLKPAYRQFYEGIAQLSDYLTTAMHPGDQASFLAQVGHFFGILFGGPMALMKAVATETLDHYLAHYAHNPIVNALLQNHEPFATVVLSVLLTEDAVPRPAMGWSLSDDLQNPTRENLSAIFPEAMLDKVYAVPQGALLADHNAMMIPSKALFEEIYKKELMHKKGTGFEKFGRYKVGE